MNSNRWLLASTAVLVGAMVLPGAASAQLLFDWGGQEKVNDSGRKSVRINADAKPGEIIVSFTDRKLYLITAPGRAISYPVAIPREQDRWEGRTRVSQKRENPSWTPTPSMLKENPRLPRWVPGGHPMNPLGNRALYLGSSYYRIHGTDAPWTIGTAVSKGCIRMYNKDALDVYEQTKVGANVLVTWKSYETAPDTDQQVATRQDSPAAAGSGSSSAAAQASVPTAAARAVEQPMSEGSAPSRQRQRVAESRYSDIFGTSEPPSVARPASVSGEEQPARSQRQTRPRESQAEGKATAAPQREPRRTREAATAPAASKSEATTSSAPVRKKEARQQSAPVETGALPEAAPRTKASPAKAAAQPVAAVKAAEPAAPPAPSAADIAAKALAAAERAAAAAERAAAAAERAERAALAKPVAPAAPAAATSAAAPAAAVSTGGSD